MNNRLLGDSSFLQEIVEMRVSGPIIINGNLYHFEKIARKGRPLEYIIKRISRRVKLRNVQKKT